MAKAKKSDATDDQKATPKTEVSDDVVEAEVVEEIPAESEISDEQSDTDTDVEAEPVEDAESSVEIDEENSSDEPEASGQPEAEESLDDPHAATSPLPEKRSGGFLPLLIGGVIAGGIGFGASQFLGPLQSAPDEATIALQAQAEASATEIETIKSQLQSSIASSTAAQNSGQELQAAIENVATTVSGLDQKFDDIAGVLAGLDARIIELEKRPLTQGLPSSAIEAYERELEELKASVAEQRAEAQMMEENARITAQQALARAALTRVISALDAGQVFRGPLTDLTMATGEQAPAELDALADTGVASLATLQADFPAAARAALATARRTEDQGGNRFLTFMQTQLGARSVTPQEGNDPDAILSRAEAAVRDGDIDAALIEVASLPDTARAEMSAWVDLATTRRNALNAGQSLAQALNSN